MKKIIALFSFVLICSIASAQEESRFSFGVKAGLNGSSLINNGYDGGNLKPGLHAGLVAEYKFTPVFALSPELMYSRQGLFKDGIYLDYINLPIMGKFYILEDELSFDLGPQLGYAMKAGYADNEFDSERYNKIDIAACAGLTYRFCPGIFLSGRYNFGFLDVVKQHKARNNSVFQFSVGYMF